MIHRREPNKNTPIRERQSGAITLRYPEPLEHTATLVLDVTLTVLPVIESYLGAPLEGDVRLEVMPEGGESGTSPMSGVVRYALNGHESRSPQLAGQLGYLLGKIIWYRGSSDANFNGPVPRTARWLLESSLLPLKYVWLDRGAWLREFKSQLSLLSDGRFLERDVLNNASQLNPDERLRAEAQCLLRSQSLGQRFPKWQSELSRMLSIDFTLSGEDGLEKLTGLSLAQWERQFREDVRVWQELD